MIGSGGSEVLQAIIDALRNLYLWASTHNVPISWHGITLTWRDLWLSNGLVFIIAELFLKMTDQFSGSGDDD